MVVICLFVGVVQGMITGIRGLCNGLGPALYGFVFYLFHVELTDTDGSEKGGKPNMANPTDEVNIHEKWHLRHLHNTKNRLHIWWLYLN